MTTFFKSSILFVLVMCFFTALSVSAYDGSKGNVQGVQLLSIEDSLAASYMLVDENGEYFSAIQDELKSGKRMRIDHRVDISTLGAWSKHLGRKGISYYVSYDLFSNEYTFDEGDGNLYRTRDIDMLRAFLFTVEKLPLVQVSRLSTGDEYMVQFKSSYKEDARGMPWYKNYNFNLLRKSVKDEVVHIAR